MESLISSDMTILFQGDSITDCGRNNDTYDKLGSGYVRMLAARLIADYAHLDLNIINRGISGNRVSDLKNRWTTDCIDLKPDLLTIMIGINNTWRAFDANDPTSVDDFYEDFFNILSRTTNELDIPIVIIEPYLLPVSDDKKAWRSDLDPKIQAIRKLAAQFNTHYIPMDGLFAAATTHKPADFWAPDGVHPSLAGHAMIAKAWYRYVVEGIR